MSAAAVVHSASGYRAPRLSRALWALLFALVGVYTLLAGLRWFDDLPGDFGDARFNQYLLEHFYRWLAGRDASFWDPAFYYPYANVMAFSSNHLGDAPIYALFRHFGCDRDLSFQLWYLAGYIASYAAAWYVLTRARFHPAAAAAAAFVFAFGLPALAQQNHAQLAWRPGIPLACWWTWRFLRTREPRLMFLAALATVWQFYAEIYTGVLLSMFLLAMLVAARFNFRRGKRRIPLLRRRMLVRAGSRGRLWHLGVGLLIIALALLLAPYAGVTLHYHFKRGWGELHSMVPRPQSWLLSDQSILWAPVSSLIQGLPVRWEHQLFVGVGAAFALVAAFFMRPQPPNHRLVRMSRVALLALVILTLDVFHVTLYRVIGLVPGLSAIRAVARIMMVLLWPISVLVAATLTQWLTRNSRWRAALAGLAMLLIAGESATSRHLTIPLADARARLDALKLEIAAAPAPPSGPPILFNASGGKGESYPFELDAMLAAQDLGLATLNGYSGNAPPGYKPPTSCLDAARLIRDYVAFEHPPGANVYESLIDRVQPVGFRDCPADWRARAGQPPPAP